jgi:hypothetical protein
MRRCRYQKCRQPFTPKKDFSFYCGWEHRGADVGAHGEKCRYDRQGRSRSDDYGYWDGTRARPSADPEIPKGIWKSLMLFCHPDKYEQEPGLKTLANEVPRWLLDHRPSHAERR